MLLFARGSRPDALGVAEAVTAIPRASASHELDVVDGVPHGLELLRDGMTFDLQGLAPGDGATFAPPRHRFGIAGDAASEGWEAVTLRPGPHIAAGARTIPVVRTLAGLAAELGARLVAASGVAWSPAGSVSGPAFFASTVRAWLDGGAFPALGLTAFAPDENDRLCSEGLAWFTGQEIVLTGPLADDRAAAIRLGVHLIDQLIGRGPLKTSEAIVSPYKDRLILEPADGGTVIAVRRG
ncbi:hypothetical protein [Tsuneonella amylolytica]|uniref:hypothetical protein n=1 Tax=Tsuneonella amylolytica TaxID=2338327 RepID=UPI0013C51752|nr:hypothetical protein [Tsuneonella amylolytica]